MLNALKREVMRRPYWYLTITVAAAAVFIWYFGFALPAR